jgi:hypothetical protein
MQMPPVAQVTTDSLFQKIGTLTIHNEFLATEAQRWAGMVQQYTAELKAEVDKIEAEATAEGKTISEEVKTVIGRVRAKL